MGILFLHKFVKSLKLLAYCLNGFFLLYFCFQVGMLSLKFHQVHKEFASVSAVN